MSTPPAAYPIEAQLRAIGLNPEGSPQLFG